MRILLVALLGAMAMTWPVLAQDAFCEELWFSRNLVFDRAGHCFQSPLGQAVFDNADCIGTISQLPPQSDEIARRIRETEAASDCAVDTNRRGLPHQALFDMYRGLETIPPRSMYESGCIGYQGSPLPLRAGARADSAVIGQALPGQNINWSHEPVDGWEFVTVTDNLGATLSFGWRQIPAPQLPCQMYAG